ncbi:MAG TPA: thioredoxin domain-containing protein [Candidatus Limnocylindria bacterium]
MTTLRNDWTWRLAIVSALIGTVTSAYLLVDYLGGDAICLTGSGCDEVRASAFAYPLGVPMPALGLGFYLAAIGVLLYAAERPALFGISAVWITVAWAAAGVVVSAGLTGVEVFVIGSICSWCTVSAAASVLLALGVVRAARDAPDEPSRDEPLRTARARRRARAQQVDERRRRNRFVAASGAAASLALMGLLVIPVLVAAPAEGLTPVNDRAVRGSGPQVVVFSDFQCPACARVAPMVEQLADDGSATLVYRYFPLTTIHANAEAAARAAEAARRQDRFWPFHDLLFSSQAQWSDLPPDEASAFFTQLAAEVSLDVSTWQADLAAAADVVQADMAEAQRLQLRGTPTIFIEGQLYRGTLSLDGLRSVLSDG